MRIPKSVKVGGVTYGVSIIESCPTCTDCGGVINTEDSTIAIKQVGQQRMEHVLLHEIVHALYKHLGYDEHDEKLIDGLAAALHAVIVDNPGMFESASAPETAIKTKKKKAKGAKNGN